MSVFAMGLLTGGLANFNLQSFLITLLVLCISLSFHEMAHAWSAHKLGDQTAAAQGRLTLNPAAHLDPIGSLAFIIGGIGWAKPVPIDPRQFSKAKTMKSGIMLTSLAGPLSNLLLASVSAFLLYLSITISVVAQSQGTWFSVASELLNRMYFANIILAVFNLLPVPPLDGFKVFGSLLPDAIYYRLMGVERYIGMVFLVLILFGRGFLSQVLNIIAWPFNQIILRPLQALFGVFWQLIGIV